MIRALAMCGATCLAATPPVAQGSGLVIPPLETRPEILLGCVTGSGNVLACLGAMTEVCRTDNDIANQNLEERRCVIAEGNVWRGLVEGAEADLKVYARGMDPATHAPQIGDPMPWLIDANADWARFAASQCKAEAALTGNSNRRAIVEDICLRDLGAQRYQHLDRLIRSQTDQ